MAGSNGATRHLLDLSTLEPERQTIRIDGEVYELALPGDFGLAGQARIARLQRLTSGLVAVDDDMTDDQVDVMVGAVDALVTMIVRGLGAETLAKLRDHQKLAIIQAFLPAAPTATASPQPSRRARPPSTGGKSSRGSTGSTAPATG
jgi:hypothetical protein